MVQPLRHKITGDRGCGLNETLTFIGDNFVGADVKMQVRTVADVAGTPLVDLSLGTGLAWTYTNVATVSAHITAGRLKTGIYQLINDATGVKFVSSDSIAVSILQIGIAANTMSGPPTGAIPYPAERGDDVVLAYDIKIDVDNVGPQDPQKLAYGEFRVRGTVTQ